MTVSPIGVVMPSLIHGAQCITLFFLLEELLRIIVYHIFEELQEPKLQPCTPPLPPQIKKATIESSTANFPPFAKESEPTMSNLICFELLTFFCSTFFFRLLESDRLISHESQHRSMQLCTPP